MGVSLQVEVAIFELNNRGSLPLRKKKMMMFPVLEFDFAA